MALPKRRTTSSAKRRRGSHFALKKVNLCSCPKCKRDVLPHHACSFCGTYKNREVIKPKVRSKKTKK